MERRTFLRSSGLVAAGAGTLGLRDQAIPVRPVIRSLTPALNAYSFNRWLLDGKMDLVGLFRFAHDTGFPAVDLTAYYIPGYPDVPDDRILFGIRRKAFRAGLALSGTGIRNDFTLEDSREYRSQIELAKRWIVAASKLGVPHVRLFDGKGEEVADREKTKARVIEAFRECAAFSEGYGVMVNFQNHFDFIRETTEVIEVMEGVRSEWFGLMLDIGSVEGPDPYSAIEKLIPYAATWQVKEEVRMNGGRVPTDFGRLMEIVNRHSYRGYFPLETLGEGDPREKVNYLIRIFREAVPLSETTSM